MALSKLAPGFQLVHSKTKGCISKGGQGALARESSGWLLSYRFLKQQIWTRPGTALCSIFFLLDPLWVLLPWIRYDKGTVACRKKPSQLHYELMTGIMRSPSLPGDFTFGALCPTQSRCTTWLKNDQVNQVTVRCVGKVQGPGTWHTLGISRWNGFGFLQVRISRLRRYN